jgi:4-hydroxybenzoate polyprenyltransferase
MILATTAPRTKPHTAAAIGIDLSSHIPRNLSPLSTPVCAAATTMLAPGRPVWPNRTPDWAVDPSPPAKQPDRLPPAIPLGETGTMIPLLRATHFQPTLAVTVIATALALAAGRGAGSAWVALAVLSGQFSVGWGNDYLDRDRDRLAGRSDKPIVAGQVTAGAVGIAAAVAAAFCVPLSLMSGWRAGSIHLAAVGIAWAYNAWLQATVFSVLPYTLAFGVLPSFITLGLPGHPWPPAWATIAAGLMGTGAHLVNTLPDLATDLDTGVRGLTHRIGPGASLAVGTAFMAATTAVLAIAPSGNDGLPGLVLIGAASAALVAVVVAGLSGHPRAAWSLTLCAAALNVAVLITRGGALVG